MIEIKNLNKAYNGQQVLLVDHFVFEKGLHYLLGPNGSGKSTLFKTLAGLIPFEGEIAVASHKSGSIGAKTLLAFSEAEPQYPSTVSGKDILYFIGEVRKENPDKVKELAKNMGVDTYWNQATATYSSGMLKKISLLSAFIGDTEWVLLDEPFILIDAATQEILKKMILANSQEGKSFVISTHLVLDLDIEKKPKIWHIRDAKIHS